VIIVKARHLCKRPISTNSCVEPARRIRTPGASWSALAMDAEVSTCSHRLRSGRVGLVGR